MIFSVIRPRLTKEIATMALDQSVLTELLDALRAGGDLDFMREAMQLVLQARSEERRVGKECFVPCRSRWSPYH